MVDRLGPGSAVGYLRVDGFGHRPVEEIRDFLAAFEDSYQAIAGVELAAFRALSTLQWAERYGPPSRYWPPIWSQTFEPPRGLDVAAHRLVVSRVVLQSPGFWEFLGSLNLLETIRRFLNDQAERKKDRDYRNEAERERMELENVMRSLEVVERLKQLEREFGPDIYSSEAWTVAWGAELRGPLDRLSEFDRKGFIDGTSAIADLERPKPDEPEPE